MCKVIRFQFTCTHQTKLRQSKCQGTYHRTKRSGRSAACSAEAYLDIKLPFECGPCQQNNWDMAWHEKLNRAETFRTKLAESGLPGLDEVSELVRELQSEYDVASWDIRTKFPPSGKSHVDKVKMGERLRRQSPLAREVKPEEVSLEEKKAEKLTSFDDDEGMDASHFEPLNYDHALDGIENPWIDELLPDNDDVTADASGFAFDANSWGNDEEPYVVEEENNGCWQADAEDPKEESTSLNLKVEEVVNVFWDIVGKERGGEGYPEPSPSSVESLHTILKDLHTSESASEAPSEASAPSRSHVWSDGGNDLQCKEPFTSDDVSDSLPMATEDVSSQGAKSDYIPSHNPAVPINTNVASKQHRLCLWKKYDILRYRLYAIRPSEPVVFSAKWLELSRQEIRERENVRPEPRGIPSPTPERSVVSFAAL